VDPRVADYFNRPAQEAAIWTSQNLCAAEKEFLSGIPLTETLEPGILLVHGSPSSPEIWSYIISLLDAHFEFGRFKGHLCLFGHSHLSMGFVKEKSGNVQIFEGNEITFEKGKRYLINPGSVGQPRDGDPRAAFGILDTDRGIFEFHRVEYDVETAQDKIRRAGLSSGLAKRLASGT
jgi:diadenosine tetraphosphatase ApaH/serine/threonine PP2A family protein phosphatase